MLGPEHSQGWVTDRELVPGCARVRTKCAEKTSVDLWGQSGDPSELPGVTGPARGWPGCYNLVSEPTLAVTRACAGQWADMLEHVPALGAQTGAKGGVPGLEVDRRGRRSSKGGRM